MSRNALKKGDRVYSHNGTVYEILELKGQGGSSLVYGAKEIESGDFFILKEYYPDIFADTDDVDRVDTGLVIADRIRNQWEQGKQIFLSEVEKSKRLRRNEDGNSPYFYALSYFEEKRRDTVFICMDNSEKGRTLREYMEADKLNLYESTCLILELVDILSELECKSLLHGDIKPDNIFLPEYRGGYRPKLIDYGSVMDYPFVDEMTDREKKVSLIKNIMGSPRYMPVFLRNLIGDDSLSECTEEELNRAVVMLGNIDVFATVKTYLELIEKRRYESFLPGTVENILDSLQEWDYSEPLKSEILRKKLTAIKEELEKVHLRDNTEMFENELGDSILQTCIAGIRREYRERRPVISVVTEAGEKETSALYMLPLFSYHKSTTAMGDSERLLALRHADERNIIIVYGGAGKWLKQELKKDFPVERIVHCEGTPDFAKDLGVYGNEVREELFPVFVAPEYYPSEGEENSTGGVRRKLVQNVIAGYQDMDCQDVTNDEHIRNVVAVTKLVRKFGDETEYVNSLKGLENMVKMGNASCLLDAFFSFEHPENGYFVRTIKNRQSGQDNEKIDVIFSILESMYEHDILDREQLTAFCECFHRDEVSLRVLLRVGEILLKFVDSPRYSFEEVFRNASRAMDVLEYVYEHTKIDSVEHREAKWYLIGLKIAFRTYRKGEDYVYDWLLDFLSEEKGAKKVLCLVRLGSYYNGMRMYEEAEETLLQALKEIGYYNWKEYHYVNEVMNGHFYYLTNIGFENKDGGYLAINSSSLMYESTIGDGKIHSQTMNYIVSKFSSGDLLEILMLELLYAKKKSAFPQMAEDLPQSTIWKGLYLNYVEEICDTLNEFRFFLAEAYNLVVQMEIECSDILINIDLLARLQIIDENEKKIFYITIQQLILILAKIILLFSCKNEVIIWDYLRYLPQGLIEYIISELVCQNVIDRKEEIVKKLEAYGLRIFDCSSFPTEEQIAYWKSLTPEKIEYELSKEGLSRRVEHLRELLETEGSDETAEDTV